MDLMKLLGGAAIVLALAACGSTDDDGPDGSTSTLSERLQQCVDDNGIALEPAASARGLARDIAIIHASCSPDADDLDALAEILGADLR